jgi:alkyl hydroperoxide reductase subunit F
MAEHEIVVIGGGPAGLAATFYALQSQLRVALVTPGLGGKVSYPFQLRGLPAVEGVWGADLVQQFEEHVEARLKSLYLQEATQVTVRNGGSFQVILADGTILGTRAVILCTGAHPQRLYVQGEEEFRGRGVSFSAISHAQFFRGRNVAVIGGGRALPAVLKLATLANRVDYVVAQRKEIEGSRSAEKVLRNPKVFLFNDWEVQSIEGDDFVTGLNLVAATGETRTLPVEGVFVEFGLLPNNELVRDLASLDEDGHIMVNHRCETSVPGLFAAGDVTNVHAEQVPVAIGEGVKAALTAWSYLSLNR